MNNVFELAFRALTECDVELKKHQVANIAKLKQQNNLSFDKIKTEDIAVPGRPDKPELVAPKFLSRRKITSPEGQAAMVHSIVHIEFNAINLALDAIYRYQDMPVEFHYDWLQVAVEEAYHFSLLEARLEKLGYKYGDFQAHNGLWEMAVKTSDDLLVRMALVPRMLEARGLDVTPAIVQKFKNIKDLETVEILGIIERDEIGHVALGTKWFNYECDRRGLVPEVTFKDLLAKHARTYLKLPIANENRKKAGFSERDLENLTELAT